MPRHYKRTVRPIIFVIGPSIAYVELTQGLYSLIESEDAARVGESNWCARLKKHSGKFYAMRETRDDDGKPFLLPLHSFLVGSMADHKNLKTLDNRRSANLRAATSQQNNYNKGKMITNTSGFKGVSWHKTKRKWIASISVNYKRIFLGYFIDPVDASIAYQNAAQLHAGEFARSE